MRHGVLRALACLAIGVGTAIAQGKPAAAPARPRLLFVVDAETEAPIAGAVVLDLITRNRMQTSSSGVVGLIVPAFVKASGALIQVSMDGYYSSDRLFVDPLSDTTLAVHLLKAGSRRPLVRQRTDSTIFSIEVLDEDGEPMPDASVAIVRGLATTLASRDTDSTGVRTLAVPAVTGDVQITAKKLGYAPYRQFYRMSVADTEMAQIAMMRLAQQLQGVTVRARSTSQRRLSHINENEIAASRRPILDALDVIRKLRPAMFGDRTRGLAGCGVASSIYVNGRRIHDAPQSVNLRSLPRSRASARSQRGPATISVLPSMTQTPPGEAAMAGKVRGVLASIKPEHVAEMTYLDCFDTSVSGLHSNNAIYVVLKPTIEYNADVGSVLPGPAPKKK